MNDVLTPTTRELEAVIGCLIEENDSLRARANMTTLCWGRRSYTTEQLDHGHDLAPKAEITTTGLLKVSIES